LECTGHWYTFKLLLIIMNFQKYCHHNYITKPLNWLKHRFVLLE
jgi:hypothetical protein